MHKPNQGYLDSPYFPGYPGDWQFRTSKIYFGRELET